MTIITTQSRISYAGDNVSTVFTIPFEFFLNSDITALKTTTTGAIVTLAQNVDYTLAGAGVIGGGTAIKTTPLLTGESLTLFLNPPIVQQSHYISNSPFPSSTLENDIDRHTQISQRLQDQINRAIRAPDGDAAPGMMLPPAAQRALTYAAFDASGNAVCTTALPGTSNTQASLGLALYPITGAESAAVVTPTFFFYAPSDVRRYGALGNGTTDDTSALQRGVSVLNATAGGNGPPQLVLYGWHPMSGTLTVTQAGVAIRGLTSSQGTCGLLQTGNVDTLILQNATPANGIRNCALYDFTIMSNSATPTAGRGLVCNFCQNLQVSNFQVVSCYQGINILGGFAQNWVNTLIFGPAGWTTRQAGTYCIRIEIGPGNSIPSEITFSNFDWKGVTNVTNGTDFGLYILCGDGLFFSNGHVGFAYTASCAIASNLAAPNFIDSVNCINVYFDGNFGGSGSGLQVTGTAGNITNLNFNSCSFRNHVQHGISCSYASTSFTSFWNCNVAANGQFGVIWNGGSDFCFFGGVIYNNNTANASANAFSIVGIANFTIQGAKIYGGSFAYPVGISADATSSGGSIIGNSFKSCTTPIVISCGTTTMGLNRLLGAVPAVGSAATLPNTYQGFDVVQVTGVTTISAGISGANIAEAKVVLNFTGAVTVNTASNLKLAGGGNQAFTAGSMLTLVNDGAFWREAARAVA